MALPVRERVAEKETKRSQIALVRPDPKPNDPHAYKWWIAVGVILAAVLELIDSSIVNVAFSQMSGNLGATIDEITWVAVGYILAAVIVLPMTGWLAARFGRKRYFLSSV